MIITRINDAVLYRSDDGREAWIILDYPEKRLCICTDVDGKGAPFNAVYIDAETMRMLLNELETGKSCTERSA